MEGWRGRSSTLSYKEAITSKGKVPLENVKGPAEKGDRNNDKERDGTKPKENSSTKGKDEGDINEGARDKKQRGPFKPKEEITHRFVLNDPAL